VWCFFDESYPEGCDVTSVVACLMRNEAVEPLNSIMYHWRHAHLGAANARDLQKELKGNTLLANNSFKQAERCGHSCNLETAKDVLRECSRLDEPKNIQLFGAVVHGGEGHSEESQSE
jgi:hypothetical protein